MTSLPGSRDDLAKSEAEEPRPLGPKDSPGRLFRRFLRLGSLAWGGPVAQIEMIRQEIVTQEKWISPAHFRRLLAIYQVLPGPEAHELCVHLGMIAQGRWGGFLAGLGFMLPGFALMFGLSWLYLEAGPNQAWLNALVLGLQPAVVALIVRACHRLGQHNLTNVSLGLIAGGAATAASWGVSWWLTLPVAGLIATILVRRPAPVARHVPSSARRRVLAAAVSLVLLLSVWQNQYANANAAHSTHPEPSVHSALDHAKPPQVAPLILLGSGLRAGLLTFGGAYTAIPFLKTDAVDRGEWMSPNDFLDGVALAGILPAPLIIFATFVGYFAGGAFGALAITLGIFLPAFGFSLIFFRQLEAAMAVQGLRAFLEGVTAAVIGLIIFTASTLIIMHLRTPLAGTIFAGALVCLTVFRSRWSVPLTIAGAGLASWALAHLL